MRKSTMRRMSKGGYVKKTNKNKDTLSKLLGNDNQSVLFVPTYVLIFMNHNSDRIVNYYEMYEDEDKDPRSLIHHIDEHKDLRFLFMVIDTRYTSILTFDNKEDIELYFDKEEENDDENKWN